MKLATRESDRIAIATEAMSNPRAEPGFAFRISRAAAIPSATVARDAIGIASPATEAAIIPMKIHNALFGRTWADFDRSPVIVAMFSSP